MVFARMAIIGILAAIVAVIILTSGERTSVATAASSGPEERSQDDPTAWWWYHGVSPEEVVQLITDNGARIVDIEVEQVSPSYSFSIAMVANEGAYAKGWWWYYGLTGDQLATNLGDLNARIIDLEVYEVGSELRFAAVLVPNTGDDSKAWWWYYGQTTTDITSLLSANNARLVDIDTYFVGARRLYSAVMVSNTGADQKAWWWYFNVTASDVSTFLQSNDARLIDIEQHDSAAETYTVVMEGCPCPYWWWYIGVSEATLNDLLAQNGARLVDVETYLVGSEKRFAVSMINNSNAITTRVGELLRNGTDGTTGLYLKEVGGPVLAALQETRQFEPASTIKFVHHLYAMQQVQNGNAGLTDPVVVYDPPVSGSCPTNNTSGTETLGGALKEMVRRSDNQRTKAIAETFGVANIDNMAQTIGMMNTSINLNHTIGCGNEAVANPNRLTLYDAGLLYEGVADLSLLNSTNRETFYTLMAGKEMFLEDGFDWTGIWEPDIRVMIDDEAPGGMTEDHKQKFRDSMRLNYKAGNYTFCTNNDCTAVIEHIAIAGWAKMPSCSGSAVVARSYVFGIFIDGATTNGWTQGATTDAGTTFSDTKSELFREQISSALSDWATCVDVGNDSDGDGYLDLIELFIGTDSTLACGPAAYPPDSTDDGRVTIADVLVLKPTFGSVVGDANYRSRQDLNADGKITIADVLALKPVFGSSCTIT